MGREHRTILEERGINTDNESRLSICGQLSFHENFMTENTIVEQYLKDRGHQAYFLPKFHCELNRIERVWAQVHKFHTSKIASHNKPRTGLSDR